MLIIGAKGFAKEVLEVLHQCNDIENLAFFDDVTKDIPDVLYEKFVVLKNIDEAKNYFQNTDARFTIGIGSPLKRKKMYEYFCAIGGIYTSTVSPYANVGNYGNLIEEGCNIMTGVVITNDILIKKGCLVNLNCTIGHDSKLDEFVELSPGVHISGNCSVGSFSQIGTNATILPRVKVGCNVIVGAGSVVTKDVPDNSLVVGIPAVIKKELTKIEFLL